MNNAFLLHDRSEQRNDYWAVRDDGVGVHLAEGRYDLLDHSEGELTTRDVYCHLDMACYVMLCYVMLCYVWYVMLWYGMAWCGMV